MDIPRLVAEICDRYCRELLAEFSSVVIGVYLHGSVALGDFQQGTSDIDFVTVVRRVLTEDDRRVLARVHASLAKAYPKTPVEGVYLMPEQLGKSLEEIPPVPGYHDSRLTMGHFSINPVTWYELKTLGITLYGQDLATLEFNGDFEQLRSYSMENINSYWRRWVDSYSKPRFRYAVQALFSREPVAWGVLGVTRLYHVIAEHRVVSKSGAGEYALEHLPQWRPIVTEALQVRKGIARSHYRNAFTRRRDLIQYMNFIIDACNRPAREGRLVQEEV